MKKQTRDTVIQYLGTARFAPYLNAAGGNQKTALHLYSWGADLASAIQTTLWMTEVVLRNAMDRQLQVWNERETGNVSWLLEPPASPLRSLTAGKRTQAIDRAERALAKRSPAHPRFEEPLTHDDILSNATFAMWKDLLPNHLPEANPSNQDNQNRLPMWDECLHLAFPAVEDPEGERTFWRVFHIHGLRNRVSHMDSLLNVDVADIIGDAFDLVGSIDPALRNWISGTSRVSYVLSRRPEI
ncbi:hypothetical protein [Corynebacterium sp. Marseille-P4321]|uniref:hypothetical protein n=1 Tax=Corynebacterium sp. Marseille-P4321 TaxID=2736603 RepID=UPI00158EF2DB|nr:hypothetical protein [Corynebacterium sp. Marseille-P4321]